MNSKISLLLLIAISIAIFNSANALKCQSGASALGVGGFTEITCNTGEQCYKYSVSVLTVTTVTKGCSSLCSSGSATIAGYSATCCSDKDLCNGSISSMKSTSVFVSLFAAVILAISKALNLF